MHNHTIAHSGVLCVACGLYVSFFVLCCASPSFRPSFRSFSVEALSAEREAMLKSNPNQDIPSPDGVERPNAKVTKIVDDIMQLNILESIQLSKALQVRATTPDAAGEETQWSTAS